jgi:hypothetical protein
MLFLGYATSSLPPELLLTASTVINNLVTPLVSHLFPLMRLGRCA